MSSRLMFMFCIHDRVANFYDTPVCFVNEATAIRWFAGSIQRIPQMANNPSDYSLYLNGTFDPDTGLMEKAESLTLVVNGLNCIENDQSRVMEDENTPVGDEAPVQSST